MSVGSPFDLLKILYTKNKAYSHFEDVGILFWLNTYLALDRKNLNTIKELAPFLFYVNPRHYFYLLFFSIPYSANPPYLKKPAKTPVKENVVVKRIQSVLGWTNREVRFNYPILEKIFLKDKATEKHWKQELGTSYDQSEK